MAFAGMNYLAILIAAVAGYGFGALWYMLLARPWMAALGKTEAEIKARPSPAPFVLAGLAMLVMAFMLAGVVGHLGEGQVTLRNGIITGVFCWFGFVLTTMSVNHVFQGARPMLTLIDSGHWLGVLLVQGAIIGAMGV